jgi:RNA polymerase sigma-70 factor (ECF subfamily)
MREDLHLVSVALAETDTETGIAEMLSQHGPVLLASARLITLDEAEAQDVVQVTFEIALRRRATLRDIGSLRAWLLAIETREAVRRVRSMRRLLSFTPHLHDLASAELPHDQSLALREGLRALPRRVRAAISLHYLAGYSVHETAVVLGVSDNTIKTQLKTGLARLRKELRDE